MNRENYIKLTNELLKDVCIRYRIPSIPHYALCDVPSLHNLGDWELEKECFPYVYKSYIYKEPEKVYNDIRQLLSNSYVLKFYWGKDKEEKFILFSPSMRGYFKHELTWLTAKISVENDLLCDIVVFCNFLFADTDRKKTEKLLKIVSFEKIYIDER